MNMLRIIKFMMLLTWSCRPIPPVLLKIQKISPGTSLLELRIWLFFYRRPTYIRKHLCEKC